MPGYDGNGNFDLYANFPRNPGEVIASSDAMAQMNVIKSGFNNVLTRDGQNSPTQDLPMGGRRHTNIADAIAENNYLSLKQFRNNGAIYATTTGSGSAYVATFTPSINAYVAGQRFIIKTNFTSVTDTPTININSLGAKSLKSAEGNNLIIQDNTIYEIVYDGTNFRVMNTSDFIETRAWCAVDAGGGIVAQKGVTSVTRTSTGVYRVVIDKAAINPYLTEAIAGVNNAETTNVNLTTTDVFIKNNSLTLVNGGFTFKVIY